MSNTIAVIPARGGSKRVPRKNVRLFKEQPLLAWSIKAAQAVDEIDRVVVSTDDAETANIAENYGAEVFWRPEELAADTSSTFDVLKHVYLEQCKATDLDPEYLVLLQPTSPLREQTLISKALAILKSHPEADRLIELNVQSLFTGRIDSGYWVSDFPESTRSQELPELYFPSGRLYIYKCSTTIAVNNPEGGNTNFVLGDYATNINIDYESDFNKLEFVFNSHGKNYHYLLD